MSKENLTLIKGDYGTALCQAHYTDQTPAFCEAANAVLSEANIHARIGRLIDYRLMTEDKVYVNYKHLGDWKMQLVLEQDGKIYSTSAKLNRDELPFSRILAYWPIDNAPPFQHPFRVSMPHAYSYRRYSKWANEVNDALRLLCKITGLQYRTDADESYIMACATANAYMRQLPPMAAAHAIIKEASGQYIARVTVSNMVRHLQENPSFLCRFLLPRE